MLISTTSSPFTIPSPPQTRHLFFIILPSPPHVGQTPCVCIIPNMLCVVCVITPLPWHVGHVSEPLPASAPVPWQCEQITSFLTLNFLVTPVATSSRLSFTLSLKSLPLNCCGRACRLPPPPTPPNPL